MKHIASCSFGKDSSEALKEKLLDSTSKPYRNARNLASGSVRLLDGATCRERRISFIPFNVLEGFDEPPVAQNSKNENLYQLHSLGFSICSSYLTLGTYTSSLPS